MVEKPRMLYRINVPNQTGPDEERWLYLSPEKLKTDSPHHTLPCQIAVRLARSKDGRLVCVGLRIGVEANRYPPAREHHEVTATMLHAIKLGQIVQDLGGYWGPALKVDLEARADNFKGKRRHPGRRGYPNAFYEGIGVLFREALVRSPRNVYRYIVEHAIDEGGRPMYAKTDAKTDDKWLELSREAVARKWVRTARKKGIIGPATPGKAGELQPRDELEITEADNAAPPRETDDAKGAR